MLNHRSTRSRVRHDSSNDGASTSSAFSRRPRTVIDGFSQPSMLPQDGRLQEPYKMHRMKPSPTSYTKKSIVDSELFENSSLIMARILHRGWLISILQGSKQVSRECQEVTSICCGCAP